MLLQVVDPFQETLSSKFQLPQLLVCGSAGSRHELLSLGLERTLVFLEDTPRRIDLSRTPFDLGSVLRETDPREFKLLFGILQAFDALEVLLV
ncbi:MAG: hypothetical protein KDB02_09440 [Acidimicrobiales bacterium]|nr:hypothetical protein [Acidimicrobiales bacterium]